MGLILDKISWYRMSPEERERERKRNLDDLEKLIEKTKKLNGREDLVRRLRRGMRGRRWRLWDS